MDFGTKMQTISDMASGSFSQYDDTTSVIIISVDEHRIQTVYAYDEGEMGIKFSSKACDVVENTPYDKITKENGSLTYARIGIEDGSIFVTARALPGSEAGKGMKDMLVEVANTADKWEFELSGKDIN